MSGVDVSRERKENQVHVCESCVNAVVQTFSDLHEKIERFRQEKNDLQEDLAHLIEEHEKQKQVLMRKISSLEEKLDALKKP